MGDTTGKNKARDRDVVTLSYAGLPGMMMAIS